MAMTKVFLGIYTCSQKQYCDVKFFNTINNLDPKPDKIFIVDNSIDDDSYADRLKYLCKDAEIVHINIKLGKNYIHRTISESANIIRDAFLKSDCDALLIIESDVMPIKHNAIELLSEHLNDYAGIGGIYYKGFHNDEWFEENYNEFEPLQNTTLLSGCTLYRRDAIQNIPFRYDVSNLGALPDAWMSCDMTLLGYKQANYTKVKCEHLHNELGERGWTELKEKIKKMEENA